MKRYKVLERIIIIVLAQYNLYAAVSQRDTRSIVFAQEKYKSFLKNKIGTKKRRHNVLLKKQALCLENDIQALKATWRDFYAISNEVEGLFQKYLEPKQSMKEYRPYIEEQAHRLKDNRCTTQETANMFMATEKLLHGVERRCGVQPVEVAQSMYKKAQRALREWEGTHCVGLRVIIMDYLMHGDRAYVQLYEQCFMQTKALNNLIKQMRIKAFHYYQLKNIFTHLLFLQEDLNEAIEKTNLEAIREIVTELALFVKQSEVMQCGVSCEDIYGPSLSLLNNTIQRHDKYGAASESFLCLELKLLEEMLRNLCSGKMDIDTIYEQDMKALEREKRILASRKDDLREENEADERKEEQHPFESCI